MRIVKAPDFRAGMLVAYAWTGQVEERGFLGFVTTRTPTGPGATPDLFLTHLTSAGTGRWNDPTLARGRWDEGWHGEWAVHLGAREFIVLAEDMKEMSTVNELQQAAIRGGLALVQALVGRSPCR